MIRRDAVFLWHRSDAVKCMHERAATFDCLLPSFGIPVYEQKAVYSDRRRSLLTTTTVSDVMIDTQLGLGDLVLVDCCEFFQDLKPKEEVYSDKKRKLLGFPRALLASDDLEVEVSHSHHPNHSRGKGIYPPSTPSRSAFGRGESACAHRWGRAC